MMLPLVKDVPLDLGQVLMFDAKNTITGLPEERLCLTFREDRRTAFDLFDPIGDRDGLAESNEQMNVIGDAADHYRVASKPFADSA